MPFNSPLTGTVGVLAMMAGLAIPLHHLTKPRAGTGDAGAAQAAAAVSDMAVPALVRVKLLAAAGSVVVKDANGAVLLSLENAPPGESEHEVALPLSGEGRCDLVVVADFGPATADTALFLTLMPDAMEPATRYLVGNGQVTEELRFQWPAPPHSP